MPKKRTANAATTSKASQLRAGPDYTWISDIQALTSSAELKQEHLERAIGLTSSRACVNKLALDLAIRNRVDEVEDEDESDDADPIALSDTIEIDSDGTESISHFPELTTPDDNRKRSRPQPKQRVYGKAQNQNKNKKSKTTNKTSLAGQRCDDRAGKCSVAGCKENLRCLNYIGAKVWLDPKSKQKFLDLQGLGPNPALEARDPLLPVGLRNLGATCYANAFLQVWYRILPFRSAVYACAMDLEMSPTSPCYQLALTFTGLQNSSKGFFYPSGLVDALKLEKGDQQDASEFSKLFMALLQTEFSKNDDPKVKSVINDQFEGQLQYKTECLTCGYISERSESFLEIEISMEGTESSLINRLEQSLTPETLDGDNRYHCSQCDQLRDAERSHQIESVPPTLNFSLLRFVFDPKTYERKKSKTTISFPPRINMRPYMSDKEGQDLWYELKGVIEHKGPSAHHGHFVARVYDTESQQWVLCDDETTTKIRAMTALSADRDAEPVEASDNDTIVVGDTDGHSARDPGSRNSSTSGKSSSKPNSRGYRNTNDDNVGHRQKSKAAETPVQLHKSQQAYMVVYGLAHDDDTARTPVPVPATRTSEQITAENVAWEACAQIYETRYEDLLAKFEQVKTSKLDVMSSEAPDSAEHGRFVSLASLKDWVMRGVEEQAAGKKKPLRARLDSPVDNGSQPMDMDAEEEEATNENVIVLNGGKEVVASTTGESSHLDTDAPSLRSEKDIVTPGPVDRTTTNPCSEADRNTNLKQNKGPKYNDPLVHKLCNKSLRCEHGKLDPYKTEEIRFVSKLAYDQMQSLGANIEFEYDRTDICRECVWAEVKYRYTDRAHQEAVENYNSLKDIEHIDVDAETYLVSGQWLKSWLRNDWIEKKEKYDHEWWNQCRSEIQCFHHAVKPKVHRKNCFIMNEVAYEVIKNDDPDAVAETILLECQQCLKHENDIRAIREAEIRQAAREQSFVRPLIQRPGDSSIVLVDEEWNYILPAAFRTAWQEFVKDPIHKMRPCLTNEEFFCQHNRITIDVNYNPDLSADRLISLLPSRWTALTRIYPIEPDQVIRIMPKLELKLGTRNVTEQEFCKPCWQLRLTGSAEKIRIRVRSTKEAVTKTSSTVENEDDGPHDQIKNDGYEIHDTETTTTTDKGKNKRNESEMNSALLTRAVRKSSRLHSKPGQKKEAYIFAAKTSKIPELKQKIEQALNISPYAQKLYKSGIELNDDKTNIQACGIVFDSVLYVQDCSEDVFGDMEDVIVVSDSKRERAAGGFQNTLLHGLAVDSKSESPREVESEVGVMTIDEPKRACSACTYLNKLGFLVCEMCETEL